MRRRIAIVGLTLAIALAGVSCATKKEPEKSALPQGHEKIIEGFRKGVEKSRTIVVAKVNGVDIPMSDLISKMNQIGPRYVKDPQKRSPEVDEKVKKEALDTLVFRELAVQEAIRQGIKARPEAVEERMKKARASLGSADAYRMFLEQSGLNEELFRKQLERDVLFDMIAAREIFMKVKVDEKRVKDTYEKGKKHYLVPEGFGVDDVFVPDTGQSDAAMDRAKEILSLIKKNNGDLLKLPENKGFTVRKGTVTPQEYPNLYKAVSSMKQGELSGIIREEDGLHIVKVFGKEPSRQMSFDEARDMIEHQLMGPVVEKRKQEWEKELKKNAKIEIFLPEVERELSAEASR